VNCFNFKFTWDDVLKIVLKFSFDDNTRLYAQVDTCVRFVIYTMFMDGKFKRYYIWILWTLTLLYSKYDALLEHQ